MAMKMCSFSVTYSFKGTLTGEVAFSGDGNYVSTKLRDDDLEQIEALLKKIQSRVLDQSAAMLLQARDDMLAIEHRNPPSALVA